MRLWHYSIHNERNYSIWTQAVYQISPHEGKIGMLFMPTKQIIDTKKQCEERIPVL